MFTKISELLNPTTTLKMIVRKLEDGTLSVTAEPIPAEGKAPIFAPLVVSGSPEELDQGFAEALGVHSVTRATLVEQLEAAKADMKESVKAAMAQAKTASSMRNRVATRAVANEAEGDGEVSEAMQAAKVTPITGKSKKGTALASIDLF